MKVRVKYNNFFAKMLRVGGVTLYPYILLSTTKEETAKVVLRHEMIHIRQVRDKGFFNFYISYAGFSTFNLFKYFNFDKAYMNNPYEVEAYRDENKMRYTKAEKEELGL